MKKYLSLALMWFGLTGVVTAQNAQKIAILTGKSIFDSNDFKVERPEQIHWLDQGHSYTKLVDSLDVNDAQDLWLINPETKSSRVLIFAQDLITERLAEPLTIEGYQWSQDQRKILIFTNTRQVWRDHTRGDYWVLDLQTRRLQQIASSADASRLMFAKFNPSADKVAYVYYGDLYIQDLETGRIRRLTKRPSEAIINGTSDWVYEEELGLRDGFRWSPDGRVIAYWQFDTTDVNSFTLINNTDDLYPRLTRFHYPKAGQTNSACRVGVVRVDGGKTTWIDIPGDPRNYYIHAMEWREDRNELVIQQLNRLQNTHRIFSCRIKSGLWGRLVVDGVRMLFIDQDSAWVNPDCRVRWLDGVGEFLWLSERDGWNHLYRVHAETGEATLLSPGDYDIIDLLSVDQASGFVYVIASPENPGNRILYQIPLQGGQPERVTPLGREGGHSYQISPDHRYAIHHYSSPEAPPQTELVHLPDHEVLKVLEDNLALQETLAQLPPCPIEFFNVTLDNEIELPGWMIKPPQFDSGKRYPLLFLVYGEPAGQTVLNCWMGKKGLWHRMLAQQGYLVASIDNRGTPAPLGRDWRKCIYGQIGIQASADQAAATEAMIKQWDFIDPNRIGIWGWSGGGSMTLNALFRYPELYRMGMSVAFVSDLHYYDTIYQERYMGLPQTNSDGYVNGSPITHAHQLQGDLLLVYGTGDDNCHFQNCEALINRLVEHNKPFDLMVYPNRRHALRLGKNTQLHLYESLTRYLHEHLPAGPRP